MSSLVILGQARRSSSGELMLSCKCKSCKKCWIKEGENKCIYGVGDMGKKARPRPPKKPKATFFFPEMNGAIGQMLKRNGYACTQEWDNDVVDAVMFTGGADVHPFLYGELAMPGTNTNIMRDRRENRLFRIARRTGKASVGICRGAQLLCVLSGGSLWQDVDNHNKDHVLHDFIEKKDVRVTSTHHQMMQLPREACWIAGAREAANKYSEHRTIKRPIPRDDWDDPEVAYIKDTNSLLFQPHPEYHIKTCENYFFECLEKYILPTITR